MALPITIPQLVNLHCDFSVANEEDGGGIFTFPLMANPPVDPSPSSSLNQGRRVGAGNGVSGSGIRHRSRRHKLDEDEGSNAVFFGEWLSASSPMSLRGEYFVSFA